MPLYEFIEFCQFDFSYTSDQEVSIWLSVEARGQSLLVLPDGRPCVNVTACGASKTLNPQHRYFLLAENLSNGNARIRLNITAVASSQSGTHCLFCALPFCSNREVALLLPLVQLTFDLFAGCGTGGPGITPPVRSTHPVMSIT